MAPVLLLLTQTVTPGQEYDKPRINRVILRKKQLKSI